MKNESESNPPLHTIQTAVEQSGLSAAVIRVWERRYQAVIPVRSTANQRLYSDEDIRRLSLLKIITDGGKRISVVADLDVDVLEQLAAEISEKRNLQSSDMLEPMFQVDQFFDFSMRSIKQLDARAFDSILHDLVVRMGLMRALTDYIHPLLIQIGEQWRVGDIRVYQEHFASAQVRSFLGRYIIDANSDHRGPVLIVATPPEHWHELGATMAGVVAACVGWKVVYLGASVPSEELVSAAYSSSARAVAVSIVYPSNDSRLPAFFATLKQQLPQRLPLLVGGSGAPSNREMLEKMGFGVVGNLQEFTKSLDRIKQQL